MKVSIPSPLLSYTRDREVEANGATFAELVDDLERQFPGIKFRVIDEQERVRPHLRFFLNGEQVFDLSRRLNAADSVQIVQALSGG